MRAILRSAIIPAYLLLCLVIGGSAQGIWSNALLQLLAIAILAWAALARDSDGIPAAGRRLFLLAGLLLAIVIIQLVPRPPAIWSQLPGRAFVANGYRMLGMELPWLPISLAPYQTMATALTLLPPLAVLAGMLRLRAFRENWLIAGLLAGTIASVIVGVLQVTSGDPSWYFYRFSNFGQAAGFFANSNHMGALLLVGITFLAALAADIWTRVRESDARSLIAALALGGAALIGVGILVNGSLAVLLLGAPVAAATIIMLLRLTTENLRRGFLLVGILLIAGAAALGLLVKDDVSAGNSASIGGRVAIWSESVEAAGAHWLTGSGLGSFEEVYRRYEDPVTVGRTYINHAHNDYLEIAIEAGLPGLVLLIVFLVWWGWTASSVWRTPYSGYYVKAATIASAALILHSLVDYPLRTAALGSVMAMCLALMSGARGVRPEERDGELRPTRHVKL